MGDFAIQFNKNSFGLSPEGLSVPTLPPNESFSTSLPLNNCQLLSTPPPFLRLSPFCFVPAIVFLLRGTNPHCRASYFTAVGPVQRMDPLGKLQVAIKNSLDVVYFSVDVPFYVYLAEDGKLG